METLPTNYSYSIHSPMPVHRFIERELIRQLLTELGALGWMPVRFDCDEDSERIESPEDTWKVFEQFNEGFLVFVNHKHGEERWVHLVGGNGEDVIVDYHIGKDWDGAFDRIYLR